ncbi:hypothetical protein KXD93_03210 [Mucilaginibacter sp. BJC16-A38]|uniref:hypothetical protein n=1 Tax=Mucilaginibacter phenanthrenivorans TaxID=1234842 RepID=UPI002158117C|nr:hypothetical protein [Mucilaginibacter phenanthrenivorans]MCR8556630.1 hypothetical protein [Mucilaginibacter phenanthrenivorans]
MTHTIENTLITGILCIIIFIPIYLAVRSARIKKAKKVSNELSKIEKELNLSLQAIEHFDSFVIAIDRAKKTIIKMALNDYSPELIDLRGVTSCRLDEEKLGKATQQLQLILLDKDKQALHHIVFYRQYVDNEVRLKRTAQVAAQWEVMIKALI